MKQKIVKVQLSLYTSASRPQMLVYDEDREWEWEGEAGTDVLNLMDGQPKEYFYAHRDKEGRIVIDGLAPQQDW